MTEKPVRHSLLPAEDDSPESTIFAAPANHALAPAARTLVVASVVGAAWAGLLLVLVVVNAISVVPALVLVVLATIVLAVEVRRSQSSNRGRNRFGDLPAGAIAQDDLQDLLEIERSTVAEERRVLIARELIRLTAEALRPDPAERSTWPTPEQFASLNNQIALLRSSASDRRAQQLPVGSPVGHLSDIDLSSAIQALGAYVLQLSRMQILAVDDPEQTRILVRDQSRLRTMQDTIVEQLREPAHNPPVR